MKKKFLSILLALIILTACRATPTTLTPEPSLTQVPTYAPSTESLAMTLPTQTPGSTTKPQPAAATPTPVVVTPPRPQGPPLPPFTINWTESFIGESLFGDRITLTNWAPEGYQGEHIPLPLNLNQVANLGVLDGLTAAQKEFLQLNGFVVIESQEKQFGDIRVETSQRTGQPYFLTVDTALHALHLLFDDLLKALEVEYFRPQIIAITQFTLDQVRTYLPEVKNTNLEAETQQTLVYLSVALRLFDPEADIDPAVADLVSRQVEQIMAAQGRDKSVVFPDFEDDYGAYIPVGHYAGDPDLESYFRGMTWYGRMHFRLQDPENPNFIPSRLPLIITLAMRHAQVDDQVVSDSWASLHETLTFVIGPSDDTGPLEYAALMDQVYGNQPTIRDLADKTHWQDFLSRSDQLPVPQINSMFIDSTKDLTPVKGWRFMGQRFTLDGLILQNVIFDRLQAKPDGTRREFPSGLDVMAVFGSLPALQELENLGATSFPNYPDQMTKLQQAVLAQPEEQWLGRFYDGWLYAFLPVVFPKDSAYPAYMQTSAWGYKDLNSALGSWAELKHDTILYTKSPESARGGGPPMSGPAPSYVEANPLAFYRLSYIARRLSCGLQNLVLHAPCDSVTEHPDGAYADSYINGMYALGNHFENLGAAAVKELAGQPLSEDDLYAITGCLGMQECMNTDTGYNQPNSEMPEVPVIAAVSGAQESVLEAGIGFVNRIYVVVPLEGKWEVAQGGVFSYYEFTQPRSQRLTDAEWRQKFASGEAILPGWASNFVLPGGQPRENLYFRIGDIYIITEDGDKLNVRDQPSTSGEILMQLQPGDYVEIIDGPVQMDGYTWWKFQFHIWGRETIPTGWAVENQEWYVRSYLPNQP